MDESKKDNGPSLGTYVETRFNLIEKTQDEAHAVMRAAFDAAHATLQMSFDAALAAADVRYTQRFEAQSKALDAAFVVAEKAVQAALAAADRAVSKAELAGDKRFDTFTEKVDAANKRTDAVEARFNTLLGEMSGNRQTKDDTRSYIAVGISLVILVLAIITFIFARVQS